MIEPTLSLPNHLRTLSVDARHCQRLRRHPSPRASAHILCNAALACLLLAQPAWSADTPGLPLKPSDSLSPGSLSPAEAETLYQQALAASRQGSPEAAALWQELMAQPHVPQRHLFDYVTTLTWAGRDAEALAWVDRLESKADTPPYVLEALARAARNRKQFSLAENLYRQVLAKMPARRESRLGLVYALADGGKHGAALAAGRQLTETDPNNPDGWIAYGYAAGSAQDYTLALSIYQHLNQLAPREREGWRGNIQALRMLGTVHLADEVAAAHPGALSAEETAALQADKTAVLIRWGAADEDKAGLRFLHLDQSLHASAQLLDKPLPGQTPQIDDRLRHDRLVALANRRKSEEAVALYADLQREGKSVPAYARAAAAAAYLELKQPEQARDLYRALLAEDPNNTDYRWGLFHALVDCEDYAEAQQVIDQLAEAEPLWIHAYSPLTTRENPAYLESRQSAAMLRAYADQLADAQQRLETLLARAPGNPTTRASLARVTQWRGWPRRALDEADLSLNIEPQFKEAHLAAQSAALARQDWTRARQETDWLVTNYPEDRAVKEAATLNALHDKPQLEMESTWDAGGEASHSFTLNGKFYAAPLPWNAPRSWRAYASFARMDASFQGGNGFRQWLGAGLDYAHLDWSAQVELRQAIRPERTGLAASVAYAPDDQWTFRAAAESDTTDLPAKGLNQNLTASKYAASVVWRRDEARQVGATLSLQDFNDGNRRTELAANWRERWVNQPRYKLHTNIIVVESDNTLRNAPYFNPSSASGGELEVIAEWLGSRRFERSLWHRVIVGAGTYAQEGFGSASTASLKYEQEWTLDHARSLVWGIGVRRHPYDGQEETARYLDLRLNWRF